MQIPLSLPSLPARLLHPYALLLFPAMLLILFVLIRVSFVRVDWLAQHKSRRKKSFMLASRALMLLMLVIAFADPVIEREVLTRGDPHLTLMVDHSSSMGVFDFNSVAFTDSLKKSIPVVSRSLADGNTSPIGDSIIAGMTGNDSLLVVTDGRTTDGKELADVIALAAALNATVNGLELEPSSPDAAVSIIGPRTTLEDVESEFTVRVDAVGPVRYSLRATVDGRAVLEEESDKSEVFPLEQGFSEGQHKIVAEITAADHFSENNVFYKTVRVEPKPKILFVTHKDDSTPLLELLKQLYTVEVKAIVPALSQLTGYGAIILDDMDAASIDTDALSAYLDNGNGLLVIGGKNSFNNAYKYSVFGTLLPVAVGSAKAKDKRDVNIIMVIDISGSTGVSFSQQSINSVEDVEKALAVSILRDLRHDDRIGVVAFNTEAYTVSDLRMMSDEEKDELTENIKSLVFGGGTIIEEGIKTAMKMLLNQRGSNNIILISDGLSGNPAWDDLAAAKAAGYRGITLFTVGVGSATDRNFMISLASAGHGVYFEPKETEQLKLVFSNKSDDDQAKPLFISDSHHFITSGLELSARIGGFNQVVPKPGAQTLVTTARGEPVLTTWRFSLGRVAALSTDDGSLWAGELMSARNSRLLSRTVNWVIGDISRSREFYVDVGDGFIGTELVARIKSNKQPVYNGSMTKIDKDIYEVVIPTSRPGFFTILGEDFAVNYPRELLNLGYDQRLESILSVSRGRVFRPDEVDAIISKVKQDSVKREVRQESYSWLFVGSAILLFLLEVLVRRIVDNAQMKKAKGRGEKGIGGEKQ